ncbi:efflux RND transporter permease subunit [Halioglobus japonicus]|uniref:efflux RND transporter permease subunit n=1 Tax=Halioglobus japonicus TaxID=930805 RepID=UPI0023E41FB8|nr:efflux RND transporter permease subunit [Halioglobus japonicus]
MFAQYIFKHPRYFALLIISVFAVGINSFSNIPRQEEPTLTNFGGTVLTFYPGATPDRVEALVTKPLEDELRKISELDKLMTTSSSGVSSMQVRLDDTLPDHELERVWSEVRDALSDAYALFPPVLASHPWTRIASSPSTPLWLCPAAMMQTSPCLCWGVWHRTSLIAPAIWTAPSWPYCSVNPLKKFG